MKTYLMDLLHAIPLAIGALLCMYSVLGALNGKDDAGSVVLGLLGIPLLFASLARLSRVSKE
jgi:hypothetical protein